MDLKKFRRPVVKPFRRVKGPTAHLPKTLRLSRIDKPGVARVLDDATPVVYIRIDEVRAREPLERAAAEHVIEMHAQVHEPRGGPLHERLFVENESGYVSTGLNRVFSIYNSVSEAIAAHDGPAPAAPAEPDS